MPKEVITLVCAQSLGTKKDPEKYGTCDQPVQHPTAKGGFHGCSSPLYREHMRNAAAASRAKAKRLKETPELVVEPEEQTQEPATQEEWWSSNIRKLERQNPELL